MEASDLDTILLEGIPLMVGSSNVFSFRWLVDTSQLIVQFKNGAIYEYDDVSEEEAREAFNTYSPGRFVWRQLRDVKPYRQIQEATTQSYRPTVIRPIRKRLHPSPPRER